MLFTLTLVLYVAIALVAMAMSLLESLGNPVKSLLGILASLAWPLLVPVMILAILLQSRRPVAPAGPAFVARPIIRRNTAEV